MNVRQATVSRHTSHSSQRQAQSTRGTQNTPQARKLNTAKINSYMAYSKEVSTYKDCRNYQFFNPYTSELISLKAQFSQQKTVNNKPLTVITIKETWVYQKGIMVKSVDSRLKVHRSYVLGMLKGALNLSLCKSEKDARRLSNLGGSVVLIKNEGKAIQWGVIKDKKVTLIPGYESSIPKTAKRNWNLENTDCLNLTPAPSSFEQRVNLLRGEVEEGIE